MFTIKAQQTSYIKLGPCVNNMKKIMNVLVCGGSGILGRHLCLMLKDRGIQFTGTCFTKNIVGRESGLNLVHCDFLDNDQVTSLFDSHKPSVCVNCIAQRFVDQCEQDWQATKQINVDLVSTLVNECNKRNIHFIHISTDYVFDGMHAPYLPDAPPNPLQNYGISKAVAEMRIRSMSILYTIVRVPVLYTDMYLNLTETVVTCIGKNVMDEFANHNEDNVSIRRPVYIPDLCEFLYWIIQGGAEKNQIYHFANHKDSYTKLDIAQLIAQYLGKPYIQTLSNHDKTPSAASSVRPYDTYLIDDKYLQNDFHTTPLIHGIDLCFKRFWHPKLNEIGDLGNVDEFFLLLDLDGTLVDSDDIHKTCYDMALEELGCEKLPENVSELGATLDALLLTKYGETKMTEIKSVKNSFLRQAKSLQFMPGMETIVDLIGRFNINHTVVTNTSRSNVEHFKSLLPSLNKLKNWVCRDNYSHPKPNTEPYRVAKDTYWKNEKFIIGFENTKDGYTSLRGITNLIYIILKPGSPLYSYFKNEDVYLIKEFSSHI